MNFSTFFGAALRRSRASACKFCSLTSGWPRINPISLASCAKRILAVIGRHVSLEPDRVRIEMDRGKSVSTLAVDIEIPNGFGTSSLIPLHELPLNDQASLDSGRSNGISGIEHSVV